MHEPVITATEVEATNISVRLRSSSAYNQVSNRVGNNVSRMRKEWNLLFDLPQLSQLASSIKDQEQRHARAYDCAHREHFVFERECHSTNTLPSFLPTLTWSQDLVAQWGLPVLVEATQTTKFPPLLLECMFMDTSRSKGY